MNECKYFLISLLVSVFGVVFFIGCEREANEPLDENILNSPELEEYIVAGADFERSLAVFTDALNKIDFSTLEVTCDADGRKVIHLPIVAADSVSIEKKVQMFNEKKGALQQRFPQVLHLSLKTRQDYIQQSIQSSANIKGEFLKLGINTSQPRLKSGNVENWYGEDLALMYYYLYSQIGSPDYKEIGIYAYSDGSYATYIHETNTSRTGSLPFKVDSGKTYFLEGGSSPLLWVAHTHRDSSDPSTDKDTGMIIEGKVPGVPNYIYYNWGLHCFYYCPE